MHTVCTAARPCGSRPPAAAGQRVALRFVAPRVAAGEVAQAGAYCRVGITREPAPLNRPRFTPILRCRPGGRAGCAPARSRQSIPGGNSLP